MTATPSPAAAGTNEMQCDLLVIGSGAGGLAAAATAAHLGLKVIVAEKFVQFGGTWRFRHVNSSSNVLLCEITPDNILYKSVALQRIPYVSCRVSGTIVSASIR